MIKKTLIYTLILFGVNFSLPAFAQKIANKPKYTQKRQAKKDKKPINEAKTKKMYEKAKRKHLSSIQTKDVQKRLKKQRKALKKRDRPNRRKRYIKR
jgi:uncharacterized membrane protein YhiD involved in acid resistance